MTGAEAIVRDYAHQERRRHASRLPCAAGPLAPPVGDVTDRAPAWAGCGLQMAPLTVPLADAARMMS